MRTIWIVRHGERVDNVDPLWRHGAPRGAWDDPTLTVRGHQQAKEVGIRLAKSAERIDHVFCSPFTRTVETATGLLNAIEAAAPAHYTTSRQPLPKIKIEPGFCESLHVCQPVPGYLQVDELVKQFPRVDGSYNPYHIKHYEEVTSMCCQKRISTTLEHIIQNYNGNILVVSHGSPISACHVALQGRAHYVGQCTISKYHIHSDEESDVGNRENEGTKMTAEIVEVDRIGVGKWRFAPILIGDSSHLSDRTNLRSHE